MWLRKCLFIFLLVFSWALFAQELSLENCTEDDPLAKSLNLIEDTIILLENIQADNESLNTALTNASTMLRLQGQLLAEQAKTQDELYQISEMQRNLLSKELRKGKILTWSLAVSVPVCIGFGIWLGWKLNK